MKLLILLLALSIAACATNPYGLHEGEVLGIACAGEWNSEGKCMPPSEKRKYPTVRIVKGEDGISRVIDSETGKFLQEGLIPIKIIKEGN